MEFSNIEILKLPDISKVHFKGIHKNYLKVLMLSISIIFLVSFLTLFLLDFYVPKVAAFHYKTHSYVALILAYTVVLTWYFVGFFKKKYAIREKDITYKSGVLMKTVTTVPFSRIQHVEINESPLARLFKLAALDVFTAGDSSTDLVVRGLTKMEALEIKEFINHQING